MSDLVLINGEPSSGVVPVVDSSVLRGDGCFEVMRSYDGTPFAVAEHLDRLRRSAGALELDLPPRHDLEDWIGQLAVSCDNCLVRVVVTRGAAVPGVDLESNVIVFAHPVPELTETVALHPLTAPWQGGGVEWDLIGAKTLSYAPNLAATRHAKSQGFDDALLLTVDGWVLEGPTFSVAWVVDDVLETPTLDLGILDSITRRVVLEEAQRMGLEVRESKWDLDRVEAADEMMALSTVREVQPVSRVGGVELSTGDVTERLASSFASIVR